jgi:hypothetical protein
MNMEVSTLGTHHHPKNLVVASIPRSCKSMVTVDGLA